MIDSMRHIEVIDPDTFKTPIHVIGAGATGSKIVLDLAKLGLQDIHVWDFDIVESHNIANQIYSNSDIGKLKVNALNDIVKKNTDTEIIVHPERVVDQEMSGVVFLLTDTMSSRREIWDNSIRFKLAVKLMVETRMGTDNGRIYTINPCSLTDINFWESTLVSDDIAEVSACGGSITVGPTATVLSGYAVWQMIRWHSIELGKDDTLENEIIFGLRSTLTLTRKASAR